MAAVMVYWMFINCISGIIETLSWRVVRSAKETCYSASKQVFIIICYIFSESSFIYKTIKLTLILRSRSLKEIKGINILHLSNNYLEREFIELTQSRLDNRLLTYLMYVCTLYYRRYKLIIYPKFQEISFKITWYYLLPF